MATTRKAAHTPGPWYWTGSDENGVTVRADNSQHDHIATIRTIGIHGAGCANARLIAQAPRMLELLTLVMDDDDMRQQYAAEWQAICNALDGAR